MFARTCTCALGLLVSVASVAAAQNDPLSLSQALVLAREQAPAVVGARGRLAQAKAELVAASMRPDNPAIDAELGPRFSEESQRQFDFGIGISQTFGGSAQRRARVAAATEAIASAEAEVAVVQRDIVREAGVAYVDAQFWQLQQTALADAIRIAAEALQAAERRFSVGDVAALDVNTARVEHARLRAEAQMIDAERLASLGTLASLLGVPTPPTIEANVAVEPRELDVLLRAVENRPELRVIDAEIRRAQARTRLAAASGRPIFGASARYDREEGDQVILGGLTITLPVFNKRQDILAEANARLESLHLERAAVVRGWSVVVRARWMALEAQQRAIAVLEGDGLPAAVDNEGLARKSYDAGQISLIDWMVLRREALQLRREHLDRLRAIAIATIELDAVAGVIQ